MLLPLNLPVTRGALCLLDEEVYLLFHVLFAA